jgi:hypothetical protein
MLNPGNLEKCLHARQRSYDTGSKALSTDLPFQTFRIKGWTADNRILFRAEDIQTR